MGAILAAPRILHRRREREAQRLEHGGRVAPEYSG